MKYQNGVSTSHGQTSQNIPQVPPVVIDLNVTTFITGASGREGAVVDQITLVTSSVIGSWEGSPHKAHPCGGIFGTPVNANPKTTDTGNNLICILSSLAGSVSAGNDNVLNRIDFI